ncbi:MAG: ATPase [Rhodospirillales bacterium]|nr:MAG: ATPase [Rhodospirillales bacterium]
MNGGKRFYRDAVAAPADAGGFVVLLDGRPIRTPAGQRLRLPVPALAEAVAGEWAAQEDLIRPETMPLTRLAATAVDRVAAERPAVVEMLVGYGGSDLLCYRAPEPPDLALRQHRCWQPLLDWAHARFGAALVATEGVMPVAQPAEAIAALACAVDELDDLELTAVATVAQATGSLIIALALVTGRIDDGMALTAAEQDADYQAERWGELAEITDRRRRLARDITDASRFVTLARRGAA